MNSPTPAAITFDPTQAHPQHPHAAGIDPHTLRAFYYKTPERSPFGIHFEFESVTAAPHDPSYGGMTLLIDDRGQCGWSICRPDTFFSRAEGYQYARMRLFNQKFHVEGYNPYWSAAQKREFLWALAAEIYLAYAPREWRDGFFPAIDTAAARADRPPVSWHHLIDANNVYPEHLRAPRTFWKKLRSFVKGDGWA